MTEKDFFEKVNICEYQKEKARFYLKYRGVLEHNFVCEYLQGYKSEKVTYCEVATAFRYDKRIRRLLFIYIGFFEEYLRAFMADKYQNDNMCKGKIQLKNGILNNKKLYNAINGLTFGQLIGKIKKIQKEYKEELFSEFKNISTNLDAIIFLRNEVCHNRFLLHNKRLKKCILHEEHKHSLWANVMNLYIYLPSELKISFVTELKNCSEHKDSVNSNQVEWCLINDIVVKIGF